MKDYYPIMILPLPADGEELSVIPVPHIPPDEGNNLGACPHCGSKHDNLWNNVGMFNAVINSGMLLGHIQECGICHQRGYGTFMPVPKHGLRHRYDIHITTISWFIEGEE